MSEASSDKQKHEHQHDHDHKQGEAEGEHHDHHAHMLKDFKRRFVVSLAVTVPVLVLSPTLQSWLNFRFSFPGDRWILGGLSTFVFFYGGWPFLKGLGRELKQKLPGMMTLIGLAIMVAYGYSSLVVFGLEGKVFFWELVTLIDVMLLGHWIEMRSVMGASRAMEKLAKLMPAEAHRLRDDGSVEEVKRDELERGDKVLIKPGEKVPTDGEIVEGESELNEALITGESEPVSKTEGDEVIGGAINGNGSLMVKVTKTGKESYVAQVIELVEEAGKSASRAQSIADKAAFWLTVIALTVGVVTLAAWLIYGKDFAYALERMVTVMVITCPHALGLAVPLVIAVITSLSAQNGILIRNRTRFENARHLDSVVFDKTGTLTKGEFGVSDVMTLGSWSEEELLARVAGVEQHSEHTIGRGIVEAARQRELEPAEVSDFESMPGKGAKAQWEGTTVMVGNRALLEAAGVSGEDVEEKMQELTSAGKTVVLAVADQTVQGLIALRDIIREEAGEAVKQLKEMGLEVMMITGDNEVTGRYVAEELGLDSYFAEVLPDKKSAKIQELQEKGQRVAMVGDGVNDAPALAQADVGIAIGAGTDIAVETADIILVKNDTTNVTDVIRLAQINHRKMLQNLAWATGYNVFAIPLAAGVLYRYGFILPPAVGAVVMSVSTIIVAINARLVFYKPED